MTVLAVGGSTWVLGMVGWLWYRMRRLEDRVLTEDTGRLRDRLEFPETLLLERDSGTVRELRPPPGCEEWRGRPPTCPGSGPSPCSARRGSCHYM